MLTFYATQPHYFTHLRRVIARLMLKDHEIRLAIPPELLPEHMRSAHIDLKAIPQHTPIVVCGATDATLTARLCPTCPRIWFEHGIGLSFPVPHQAYPGGGGIRATSSLILSPNNYAFMADQRSSPHIPATITGVPKMDAYRWESYPEMPDHPRVVFQTHWNCLNFPETRSAFNEFASCIPALKKLPLTLVGHHHPRASRYLVASMRKAGLPLVSYDEAMSADILIGDCGSMMYEFAAQNKPVVVLNAKCYRKKLNFGLRFWKDIPGRECSFPHEVPLAVRECIERPAKYECVRSVVTRNVFPFYGNATEHSADAILNFVKGLS